MHFLKEGLTYSVLFQRAEGQKLQTYLCSYKEQPSRIWASLVVQTVKNLPAIWETRVQPLDWEGPLEKEMTSHSSILAWGIPWTGEPGGLQFMGWQRARHDWATHSFIHSSYVSQRGKRMSITNETGIQRYNILLLQQVIGRTVSPTARDYSQATLLCLPLSIYTNTDKQILPPGEGTYD